MKNHEYHIGINRSKGKSTQAWNAFICLILILLSFVLPSCSNTAGSRSRAGQYSVLDFGAKPDSTTLNTAALQNAIDQAYADGGGIVLVPPGVYKTGTLFLKNNITLEVMAGATLLGSAHIEDYQEMSWGHNKDRQPYHLIMGLNAKNIEIRGGGTIDGNGPAFWKDYDPSKDPQWIMAKERKVSPMLEIQNCEDVRIKDVELKTGGGWTVHLYDSKQIQIQGIRLINNLFAPNGDGIDITGCEDVTISDCIIKTCDDAVCLKTTFDSKECKKITVANNVIECSCVALKVGNESFRDISQVTFTNNVIYNSSRALGIYAESAGKVEDIVFSNTIYDSKSPFIYNRPIHISLMKRTGPSGATGNATHKPEVVLQDDGGREPVLRNIMINNFIGKTEGRILITAEPGRMIENLSLRDIQLDYPWIEDPEPNIERAKSSQFSPMNPNAKKAKAAMVVENVKNLVVENFHVNWPTTDEVPEDWRFPKRIANGTLDAFYPDYTKARQTELSAIWARNIQGGYIRAPLLQSSDSSMPTFDIKDAKLKMLQ
ncbi:MAG: right-handed parallel beta-helix repeat-containing protein [Saprospiraceae bacterium]|nr:right-handed parallel beta-helix repeat-containing protein [Saprospiraceae bacterium]